jgi:hypothetical protein
MNENLRWARNIYNNANPCHSGSFLREIAIAFISADDENRIILDDAITTLRAKYPKYDIEEKEF